MFRKIALACLGTISLGLAQTAASAEPLRIGFITTLSTPAGYIGEDQRDAFKLAIDQEGGKLGGVPVEMVLEDDGLKPATGKQSAEKMLQEGIQLFTGINFSNVLMAAAPTILKKDAFYVSLNAGPSVFAGKRCDKNYFVASFENTSLHAAAGQAANEQGIKNIVLLAPNYQAGRDALEGFKRLYKGKVMAEIYTKLDQSDFSVELARVRDLAPDAIYQFHPGGAGINFAKQYANSGLSKQVPMFLPVFSMDLRMIQATGNAAEGVYSTALWSPLLDVPESKQFVEDFKKAYGRVPTHYAALAYDTALLIASALKAVDGDLNRADEFRAALQKADFKSVRGNFAFDTNHHPIQDYYLTRIERDADGNLMPKVLSKVLSSQRDAFAAECSL
ncbi:ABC transporter substrate-binding protein [Pusillimonas noertemannii]|uniref:Amino acid/amide ABC transporter substrate-binding protein (HAAT family) n=1 Tax=Pusillimonas noertemannii TaxID=305977 RepID=A0A2U1CP96_9BURK|nr:ABC transporter substrate-binding protein [Pusillimonas noertemannii]NYT66981.1 ABC transporter substrate-binding protein [Pusillimonas noertemannii]PVY67654.1 amino acid/amide ABC transporter substrate-binding protein (HAAT family) [Pusillimonas noertemannii]TFL12804.1 ABC transporter substrate-binding protein [Pusillimonas noertemannii]